MNTHGIEKRKSPFFYLLALLLASLLTAPSNLAQTGQQPDITMDAATRKEVIEGLLKNLNEYYVFADVAKKMGQAIRQRLQRGEYEQVTSAAELAKTLTAHLQEVSRDGHLNVRYSRDRIPAEGGRQEPGPEELERARYQGALRNFGFEKVERLPGNVGYMDVRGFGPGEWAGDTAVAAMAFLANTDALIIDLRNNGGGGPDIIVLLSSYLFGGEPVHLMDTFWREGDQTIQRWTMPYIPGKRYLNKDVYVLTSNRTISAAESFTYGLQSVKRAIVVGETTRGGAHPGAMRRINDHFAVFLPNGRAINPVTKTNWEGVGVKPDINVSAEQALKTAHLTAISKLVESTKDAERKGQLKSLAETLKKELENMRTENKK
jgi:C-terminal processing protease CtpA/Prc